MTGRVYCAIDTNEVAAAERLGQAVGPVTGAVKLGLEFFCAHGAEGVRRVAGTGLQLFLDLKLHDIPNTVAGAVRAAVGACRPALMTIHAAGGPAMMAAAQQAAVETAAAGGFAPPRLIAVTVLTSLDDADLAAVGQQGPVADQALRLAELARRAGLAGVVCSPHEIAPLRRRLGPDLLLVVPGIRPAGSGTQDQKRVMTPAEAIEAGADHLVIGRPITAAPDPAAAARAILQSLAA